MTNQDVIFLGISLKDYVQYIFMCLVGFCVGALFVMRTISNEDFKNRLDKIRYILWGIGSSMLTTWIAFEALQFYTSLPTGLITAISGGIGYIGAEVMGDYALKLLSKKLDLPPPDKKDEAKK
ncbi:holin [Helicobacter suis]|uniref:holin n=1 Tax=Helicobacter suis TaxID=104628 RepID=UPI0013D12004|nr:holin [Helicobacter suis]